MHGWAVNDSSVKCAWVMKVVRSVWAGAGDRDSSKELLWRRTLVGYLVPRVRGLGFSSIYWNISAINMWQTLTWCKTGASRICSYDVGIEQIWRSDRSLQIYTKKSSSNWFFVWFSGSQILHTNELCKYTNCWFVVFVTLHQMYQSKESPHRTLINQLLLRGEQFYPNNPRVGWRAQSIK